MGGVGSFMYNPYAVLGIKIGSSVEEAKNAYRKLSRVYHPDNLKTGNADKFREISEAWNYIQKNPIPVKQKVFWRHKTLFKLKKEIV